MIYSILNWRRSLYGTAPDRAKRQYLYILRDRLTGNMIQFLSSSVGFSTETFQFFNQMFSFWNDVALNIVRSVFIS